MEVSSNSYNFLFSGAWSKRLSETRNKQKFAETEKTMMSKFLQLQTRERNDDFWKHITPNITPFNHPVFEPDNQPAKNIKSCVFKQQIPVSSLDIQYNKATKSQFDGAFLKTADETTQSQFDNTLKDKFDRERHTEHLRKCLNKNEEKCKGLIQKHNARSEIIDTSNDLIRGNELSITTNKLEPSLKVLQIKSSPDLFGIKNFTNCYVRLERLNLEKIILNKRKVFYHAKYNSKTDFNNANTNPNYWERHLNQYDEMLNMYPRVCLRRIEESVSFLRNLGLRPSWKNSYIFQTPVKPRKLRNSIRRCRMKL